MNSAEYHDHMDALAITAANSLHGQSPHDVAHACAVVSVHAIFQSTDMGAARERRLEALFEFMRSVMASAEKAERSPLQ